MGNRNNIGNKTGSAYIFKKQLPDLNCNGDLSWPSVNPGETVSGEFLIANLGEPKSKLN